MVTPAARREAIAHLRVAFEVSERRGCSVLEADRRSIHYRSRRGDDATVRACLRELATLRRRFGYRRLHILLRREGIAMNHKKFRRLYREERLQVRRRGGRKLLLPPAENALSDAMAAGYVGGTHTGTRGLFKDPRLVGIAEPSPMPFTRPRYDWLFSVRRGTPDLGED
jgi:transposase InsO family protein